MAKTVMKGLPNGQPQLNELFWDVFRRRLSQHKISERGARTCILSSVRAFESARWAAGSG